MRLTDDGCSSAPSCTVETSLAVLIPSREGRCFTNTTYPDWFLPVGLGASAEIHVDVLDDSATRFATQGILLH
jgi:hypothetical protein